MNKKDFYTISMNGMLAYQLMCFERYLVRKYPDVDFSGLMKLFWPATNGMFWDKFVDYAIELSPSYFLETDSYEEQEWQVVTKEMYAEFKPAISQLGSDIDVLLEQLKNLAYTYEGTNVKNPPKDAVDALFETIDVLRESKIELPHIKDIEFSTIDQFNGWGDKFDGTKLSIILNKSSEY